VGNSATSQTLAPSGPGTRKNRCCHLGLVDVEARDPLIDPIEHLLHFGSLRSLDRRPTFDFGLLCDLPAAKK